MDFNKLIAFLKGLQANNNKDWFEANRKEYELLRAEFVAFVATLIQGISVFEPEVGSLDAKKCLFRINKDVRFSKDKSPYKTNFGASINAGGKKSLLAGYYFHVDPKEIFVAGGCWMASAPELTSIRQEIDYNFDEFSSIVKNKSALKLFKDLSGEKLVRAPKGYEEANPAIDYLKHKSFVWVRNIEFTSTKQKDFSKELIKSFEAMKPLNDFINRAISN